MRILSGFHFYETPYFLLDEHGKCLCYHVCTFDESVFRQGPHSDVNDMWQPVGLNWICLNMLTSDPSNNSYQFDINIIFHSIIHMTGKLSALYSILKELNCLSQPHNNNAIRHNHFVNVIHSVLPGTKLKSEVIVHATSSLTSSCSMMEVYQPPCQGSSNSGRWQAAEPTTDFGSLALSNNFSAGTWHSRV